MGKQEQINDSKGCAERLKKKISELIDLAKPEKSDEKFAKANARLEKDFDTLQSMVDKFSTDFDDDVSKIDTSVNFEKITFLADAGILKAAADDAHKQRLAAEKAERKRAKNAKQLRLGAEKKERLAAKKAEQVR